MCVLFPDCRFLSPFSNFYLSWKDALVFELSSSIMAPNSSLPIWGNEKTMNLNHLILTNIQSSPYFKVNLFGLKTYHEVIDEIYYKVGSIFSFIQNLLDKSKKTSVYL